MISGSREAGRVSDILPSVTATRTRPGFSPAASTAATGTVSQPLAVLPLARRVRVISIVPVNRCFIVPSLLFSRKGLSAGGNLQVAGGWPLKIRWISVLQAVPEQEATMTDSPLHRAHQRWLEFLKEWPEAES